jgi:hypothetical protein
MTHFAVYDKATGAIARYGSCAPGDLVHQAQAGEAVIETAGPAPGDRPPSLIERTPGGER